MTLVKICGIKNEQTLGLLSECGVDYAGFVFAPSKRQVTAAAAGEMLRAVPEHPPAVGVFVNPTIGELTQVLAEAPLAVIQLHGQETPAFCQEVKERFSLPVWKAMAVGKEDTADRLAAYANSVDAFLFDTYDPAQAGGTGKRFTWEDIPGLREACQGITEVIAGGIHAGNVTELIERYQPAVIDLSSGVETDGEKDSQKIRELMERVKGHG
ncbi:phosphoribosylanthranilate isomerase [Brevibacillus panacihumi]|uniref:N-(5'-phosphoribosyl)anthranilate isomerase n=1 Tax=Brevibacillus panacihumi TaxID=497735 RepID=A0A3M8DA79_9BACL|nr:phosphoribosylanthranilate isomerase [Brevibacillus panacihumi]RNB84954.1 phosphoribosylanthranilate isomerase [Brevibacillus panacihumi]